MGLTRPPLPVPFPFLPRIVILEYSTDKGGWERVHCETFGKSGVRRIVPGQYVAADPRARAVRLP